MPPRGFFIHAYVPSAHDAQTAAAEEPLKLADLIREALKNNRKSTSPRRGRRFRSTRFPGTEPE